jgi:aryl-phospho-beta-D-glucosidase BglC (GH1 family)
MMKQGLGSLIIDACSALFSIFIIINDKLKAMNRRKFLNRVALSSTAMAVLGKASLANRFAFSTSNALPMWKGFNLMDYFNPSRLQAGDAQWTTEEDLKWMIDWGFNFVRIPIAYPRYLSLEVNRPISPEEVYHFDDAVLDDIERLVQKALSYGLHVSLNLHRAPGFCINAGFQEPFNLWKDEPAQEAFAYHWGMWAQRFRSVASGKMSFDLLNEPAYREDMNDQFSKSTSLPGDLYRSVAARAVNAIREANPGHLIIADGNRVGNDVTPELIDLNVAQSCRGYYPHYVSHYQAPWAWKDPSQAPLPVWPGIINGEEFNRGVLERYYQPWIDLKNSGVGVHCGECGCWNKTPHEVALAWLGDIFSILSSQGIGYALWNFRGDFGILDSERSDVKYTEWYGHKLDKKLLNLMLNP